MTTRRKVIVHIAASDDGYIARPDGSVDFHFGMPVLALVRRTNFAAERMIMGQKVEAAVLRATANPQGFQLRGDVKIAGAPMSLEYRKTRNEPDAEVRLQGMLDDSARRISATPCRALSTNAAV